MRRFAGVVATIGAAVVAIAVLLYSYYAGYRPSAASFPVRGVDVSHHQAKIDWQRVANDNIRFAYVKATEGAEYRDQRFSENWSGARAAGLQTGAYHFFSLCRPGADQARNFTNLVPHAAGQLAPALDLEFGGNCSARPTSEKAKAAMSAYSDAIFAAYAIRPVLYVTNEFLRAYGDVLPENAGMWIRSIAWSLPRWRSQWTLWQYHNRGRVDGIDGPVDLNVFNGSPEDFEAKAPVVR